MIIYSADFNVANSSVPHPGRFGDDPSQHIDMHIITQLLIILTLSPYVQIHSHEILDFRCEAISHLGMEL